LLGGLSWIKTGRTTTRSLRRKLVSVSRSPLQCVRRADLYGVTWPEREAQVNVQARDNCVLALRENDAPLNCHEISW